MCDDPVCDDLFVTWEYQSENQCCGSGMFIPDPDFYLSRIPNPGSKNSNKREEGEKIVVLPSFVAININHKIENYFIFEQVGTEKFF